MHRPPGGVRSQHNTDKRGINVAVFFFKTICDSIACQNPGFYTAVPRQAIKLCCVKRILTGKKPIKGSRIKSIAMQCGIQASCFIYNIQSYQFVPYVYPILSCEWLLTIDKDITFKHTWIHALKEAKNWWKSNKQHLQESLISNWRNISKKRLDGFLTS